MLDVINELRAAGAEAMEIRSGQRAVRIGVDTWVVGADGALEIDGADPQPAVFCSGDW